MVQKLETPDSLKGPRAPFEGAGCLKGGLGVVASLQLYRMIGEIACPDNPQLRFAQQPPEKGARGAALIIPISRDDARSRIRRGAFFLLLSVI